MRLTRRGEVVLAATLFVASTVLVAVLLNWALGQSYIG